MCKLTNFRDRNFCEKWRKISISFFLCNFTYWQIKRNVIQSTARQRAHSTCCAPNFQYTIRSKICQVVILYKFLIKKIPKFSVLHKGNLHKRLSTTCTNIMPHFCAFCILIFWSSHGILITSNEREVKRWKVLNGTLTI